MSRSTASGALAASALAIGLCASATAGDRGTTALEQYVYMPDPAFGFILTDTQVLPGYTAYTLLMDSLAWRSGSEVDRTLWTHQVNIVVPDQTTTSTALLLINGGSDPLDPPDPLLLGAAAAIAVNAGSVLAAVSQIPNQPLQFPDEDSPISEDALVAYSWDKALASGDATWAAYLPMTKASVRAMDAVQDFVNATVDNVEIDNFAVTGFSKRGATAWLVAAVDPRVRAAAPGVFDILNMSVQIERHWQAYGFYAPAIGDYVDYDIVRRVRSPEGRWLQQIVDPFSYTATLHLPKLILSSTGDQFFLPDAAHFYLDGLPGETLMRQLPNTDHGLTNGLFQALDTLLAWYLTVVSDTPRPAIEWTLGKNNQLEVTSEPAAQAARLWQATNTSARDFRLESLGAVWSATDLSESAAGVWQVSLTEPALGWTGYLVELEFPGVDGPPPQTYSTPVFVLPEELPFVLDEPLGRPQVARYWRCQLPDAPSSECPRPPEISAEELDAFLPIPVFGQYVRDLDEFGQLMSDRDSPADVARLMCMATRLNIASGEFGWYTAVGVDPSSARLWEAFEQAGQAFADNDPVTALRLCGSLNRGTATPVLP